jgi:hypothetical protein
MANQLKMAMAETVSPETTDGAQRAKAARWGRLPGVRAVCHTVSSRLSEDSDAGTRLSRGNHPIRLLRDEVHQVPMHFLEVRQIDIHHVAPLVLGELDVTADFRV